MSFILKCSGINIFKKGTLSTTESIFQDQEFELPSPGVYTLEGPNQSGKSVLIKMLMGALPPGFNRDVRKRPVINQLRLFGQDDVITVRSVSEAQQQGLAAVFQDDTLIPSMTVREQLLMRHASPALRHYIGIGWRQAWDRGLVNIVKKFSTDAADYLKRLQIGERRPPKDAVLRRANELLSGLGSQSILDQLPAELSGGKKAIARIVSALLVPNIRILFLDEAFANVDRATWMLLIEYLRAWQQHAASERVVVAVSHDRGELSHWRANGQFEIIDKRIVRCLHSRARSIHRCHPKRFDTFPIFELSKAKAEDLRCTGKPTIVTTESLADAYPNSFRDITSFLREATGETPHVVCIPGNETAKSLDVFTTLVQAVLQVSTNGAQPGPITVVGGGAVLNVGGFAAGVIQRGKLPLVLVPTNFTALADVVIGSKTSVNIQLPACARNFKNSVGAYIDPSLVLLDHRFFEGLPGAQKRLGLVECLKHGLLQDKALYERVIRNMCAHDFPYQDGLEISLDVLRLKNDILMRWPWETETGRLLRFGHCWAHALERASAFEIHHSTSVLWGMLVEFKLAHSPSAVYREIRDMVVGDGLFGIGRCAQVDMDALVREIQRDPYDSVKPYQAICVPEVGYYGRAADRVLITESIELERVVSLIREVIRDLSPAAPARQSGAVRRR